MLSGYDPWGGGPHNSSHDVSRLFFPRSDEYEQCLYNHDADGSPLSQLFLLRQAAPLIPRGRPDDHYISYQSNVDGNQDVYSLHSVVGHNPKLTR